MKRAATSLALLWCLSARTVLAEPAADTPAPESEQAAAVDENASEATRLFREGKELYGASKYEQACAKFEQSLARKPGVGTEFNLADCWEKLGRTASARTLFAKVEAETKEAGQDERSDRARDRARALEPKLTRLALRLSEHPDALVLELDQRALDTASLATPVAVDPGTHHIVARAPGRRTWSLELATEAGDVGKVIVEVPALENEPAPPAAAPKAAAAATDAAEHRPDWTRRNVALALAGGGALSLLFGVAMGEQYVGSHQDAKAVCARNRECTGGEVAMHQQLERDEQSARTWAYVAIPVGGAALAGAAIVYFTDPERRAEAPAVGVRAEPLVSFERGATYGARLRGAF